jgi:hypothetical protein
MHFLQKLAATISPSYGMSGEPIIVDGDFSPGHVGMGS